MAAEQEESGPSGTIDDPAEQLENKEEAQVSSRHLGFHETLNEQQRAALEELRTIVREGEFAEDLERIDDEETDFLLRFLRATMRHKHTTRVFDVKAAAKRLNSTLRWKRSLGLNKPFAEMEKPSLFDLYLKHRPQFMYVDPSGYVVSVDKLGLLASYLKVDFLNSDQLLHCVAYQAEMNMATLRKSRFREYHVILDVKGLTWGVFSRISLIRMLNRIFADHYPEIIRTIHIVHAGFVWEKLWKLISTFIDSDTRSKVQVFRGIPAEQFRAEWDPLQLPKEYGGDANVLVRVPLDAPKKFHHQAAAFVTSKE